MRDRVSVDRVASLHPKIREEVSQLIDKVEIGFPTWMAVRIVQGYRTIKEQNELYAQGRDKFHPGKIVTNAKGGASFHNYGLALDFAILYDKDRNGSYDTLSWDLVADMDRDGQKDWMEVVSVFKAAGWEWGGDWHSIIDNPHLQKTFGYTWEQLLDKYYAKQLIPGTEYVNI